MNAPVDVPFVNVEFVANRFVEVAFVTISFVANRFVTNPFVAVVLVKTPVDGVVAPIAVPLIEPPVIVAFEELSVGAFNVAIVPLVARKFVPVADVKERDVIVLFVTISFVAPKVVAKRFVDVVLVPVAFVQVRFVKEDGALPVTMRF